MPGLTLVDGHDAFDGGAVDAALESLRFFDSYGVETLYDDGERLLAATRYPEYPLHTVEDDDRFVALEGEIYDVAPTDLDEVLRRVARWADDGDDDRLARWLTSCDGEFLLVVVPKGGDAVVVNDALGRLPTYRANVGGADVVTRELKFVREAARRTGSPVQLDRLGAAQTLLFGYRMRSRTLFEGVSRVPPAARLRLGSSPDGARLYRHDFGECSNRSKSVDENARRLARRFVGACRRRAERSGTPVVSLSGGFDSRSVVAGLAAADAPVEAATFVRSDGGADADADVARRVAATLTVPWTPYRVADCEKNTRRLLDTMQGSNSLAMSFVLDFLRSVRDDYDAPTLFTGDGGDKVFPRVRPDRSFDDVDDLLEYVLDVKAVSSVEAAATVAGVAPNDLRESVRATLSRYPEESIADRYAHFYRYERGINWLNLGEDRNRYYCWSTAPFYSFPLFRDAANCPEDQKSGMTLYRRFLRELSPRLVELPYADFGAPVTSAEYRLKRWGYDLLHRYPRLKRPVVERLTGDDASDVEREICARATVSDAVSAVLSGPAIHRAVESGAMNTYGAAELRTVVTLVDDLYADRLERETTPRKLSADLTYPPFSTDD